MPAGAPGRPAARLGRLEEAIHCFIEDRANSAAIVYTGGHRACQGIPFDYESVNLALTGISATRRTSTAWRRPGTVGEGLRRRLPSHERQASGPLQRPTLRLDRPDGTGCGWETDNVNSI